MQKVTDIATIDSFSLTTELFVSNGWRKQSFPLKIESVVKKNPDGTIDIYFSEPNMQGGSF